MTSLVIMTRHTAIGNAHAAAGRSLTRMRSASLSMRLIVHGKGPPEGGPATSEAPR